MKNNSLFRVFLSLLVLFALTSLTGCGSSGGGGGGVTLPEAPSNFLASLVTGNSARISWTDNSDDEDGFQIGTCISTAADAVGTYCLSGWSLVDQTTANFYELSNLSPGENYLYYVRAYNVSGSSKAYEVAFSTLPPPTAPSDILATLITETSARLAWTDNSDNEDGFEVGQCLGDEAIDLGGTYCATGWSLLSQVTETFYDLSGLDPDTSYTYYVRAYNAQGASNAYRVDFVTSALPLEVAVFTANLDNTITDLQPTTTFASNDGLGVGCVWQEDASSNVSGGCAASLVHFDLSPLAGRTIQSATLQLAVAYLGEPSLNGELSLSRDWAVTPVGETIWDETVTWEEAVNLLSFRNADGVILSPPSQQFQALTVDVTAFVQNWVAGTWSNNGVLLRLTNESLPATVPGGINEDNWAFFSHDFNIAFGPRLTVVYQ